MRPGHKVYCRAVRLIGRLWSGHPRLLFIGDSLTTGCYPWFLVRRIRKHGLSVGLRIIAKSGVTTRDVHDLLVKQLQRKRGPGSPHAPQQETGVVVLVGGNDLKCGYDFQRHRFEHVFSALLGSLRSSFPRAVLCVGTYPIPGPHARLRPNSTEIVHLELNPTIRTVAKRLGYHLCELESIFEANNDLRRDGVHPTLLGEHRMADVWFKTIFPLLEATLKTDTVPRSERD